MEICVFLRKGIGNENVKCKNGGGGGGGGGLSIYPLTLSPKPISTRCQF